MRVVQLIAENIKKIKAIIIKPVGNVIQITGANEQGKTTVLDCIFWALGGSKDIQEKPIREGQEKGKITLDLGDLVVTRKFTKSGSTLEVANKEGAVYKSPQAILDGIVGKFAFDPLKFAKSKKDEQVNTLLSVVDLKIDYTELNGKMYGIEAIQDDNPIKVINLNYKSVYEKRALVNRDLERVENQLKAYEGVNFVAPVVISDLITERDNKLKVNQENQKKRELVNFYERELSQANNLIKSVDNEIADLKSKLDAAEKRRYDLIVAKTGKEKALADYNETISTLVDEDLTEINNKLATADEQNTKARRYDEKVKLETEFNTYSERAKTYTEILENIKKYKEELISSAKFPVDGLGFSSDGVTLNGLPFEQASSAQKLRVSVAIAMALNPKLKVIRIDDGSLLDSKSMAIIEEMAAKNSPDGEPYQVWMECVDESGKVGICIEDGEIKSIEQEEPQTELALN